MSGHTLAEKPNIRIIKRVSLGVLLYSFFDCLFITTELAVALESIILDIFSLKEGYLPDI
jgi:hypothetical protein